MFSSVSLYQAADLRETVRLGEPTDPSPEVERVGDPGKKRKDG